MNITQSILVFLLSVLTVVALHCLLPCYYKWKQKRDSALVEEQLDDSIAKKLKETSNTGAYVVEQEEIEMQPVRPNLAKINLLKLIDTREDVYDTRGSRRILSSLDSKRINLDGMKMPVMADTPKYTPKFKHQHTEKLVKYTAEGLEVLEK